MFKWFQTVEEAADFTQLFETKHLTSFAKRRERERGRLYDCWY